MYCIMDGVCNVYVRRCCVHVASDVLVVLCPVPTAHHSSSLGLIVFLYCSVVLFDMIIDCVQCCVEKPRRYVDVCRILFFIHVVGNS